MSKYDLEAIPVVNEQKQLVGRITIDDIVDLIKDEAEKDYLRWRFTLREELVNILLAEIVKCPSKNTYLFPHIINIVLCSDIIAVKSVQTNKCIAEYGVSCTTNVKRSVGVG